MGYRNNKRRGNSRNMNGRGRPRFNRPVRKKISAEEVKKMIQRAMSEVEVMTEPEKVESRFVDYGLHPLVTKSLARVGFEKPTLIQHKAIPQVLLGRDVVGLANTGEGKTVAFLIPMLDRLARGKQTKVLIVAPTRELAMQIDEALKSFRGDVRARSVLCIGGVSDKHQVKSLKQPFHFVIGTPGRLKDLAERGLIGLERFDVVVLDEADRMMDMGFLPGIKYLLAKMPENKQALCFSATMPKKIHQLIWKFLRKPVTVSVKANEVTANVEQKALLVDAGKKVSTLAALLEKNEFEKVLVFGRTKHGVKRLARQLAKRGIRSESIHGNKTQNNRKRALDDFCANRVNVLVATDIASRGIDVADITHVVNYDAPATYEDYVHRIGRTGRAGARGVAVTFVEG